jgi:hypothetical protein
MRRILLIAAMLFPIASAMAATPLVQIAADVNPTQHTHDGVAHKTVTISYIATVDVRAFALDINVDGGCNIGDYNEPNWNHNPTGFLRGESIDPSIVPGKAKGYGIFPGRFRDFIDPTTPDWPDHNYMPITPWAAPGAENTGLGWPKMVVEMGTLWASGSGDINKPALTGNLFTFDVNSEGNNDCNMTVAVNVLRGGIVGSDAAPITDTNLPFTKKVTFAQGCTVPDCVGGSMTAAQCRAAIIAAGFTSPPREFCDWGTGQPIGRVIAQVPAGGTPGVDCATVLDFNDVNYPIKVTALNSLYANWVLRGKPQCWAYPRQCRGDATGSKQLQYWVASNDLSLWKSAQGKLESILPPLGICADFTHSKQLQYWVASNDLALWKSYQGKLESLVPVCGNVLWSCSDPNYHYWCIPTGQTCPAGQRCAPAGVCPNTP